MSFDVTQLREGAWSLDEFVGHANRLLPDLLPKDAGKRATEPVNQRLVRHYATQGLLDEPLKEGREARYLYRHLLQLLVVRRLLAEGFTAAVVGNVLENRSDAELAGLLSGQLHIDLVPQPGRTTSDRSDFLRQVRERAGLAGPSTAEPSTPANRGPKQHAVISPASVAPAINAKKMSARPDARAAPQANASRYPASPFQDSTWSHVTIMDGLELLVREDFRLPDTRLGDAELVQLLKVSLLYLEQKQRGKS